jgi:hypothetical protein
MHEEDEMKTIQLSTNAVAERLKEAAETLKRLPDEKKYQMKSNWPDTIPVWGDYGDKNTKSRLIPLSPEAIDRMDETLYWLRWLDPGETKIAWAVACGVNRKVIGASLGVHRTTIWREWKAVIRKLTAIINFQQK